MEPRPTKKDRRDIDDSGKWGEKIDCTMKTNSFETKFLPEKDGRQVLNK
jgi:hypothetical protein